MGCLRLLLQVHPLPPALFSLHEEVRGYLAGTGRMFSAGWLVERWGFIVLARRGHSGIAIGFSNFASLFLFFLLCVDIMNLDDMDGRDSCWYGMAVV